MDFALAWNYHQKRAKHHWQYWVLTWDRGDSVPLPMPDKYAREMVADWWGAGKAITGNWDAQIWYLKHRGVIKLHEDTTKRVNAILEAVRYKFETPAAIAQRIRILGY
jgi:hypothetical protein